MDQQGSDIRITPFADAAHSHLATGALVARHKTQAAGELTGILPARTVSQRCCQCGGSEHADAGDLAQAPGRFIGLLRLLDLAFGRFDVLLQLRNRLQLIVQQLHHQRG
ncbi:hypothetical protein D9M68_812430 [compost metagenome]